MAQRLHFARPPHLASRDPLAHHLHRLLLRPEHDGVHGPQDRTPVGDDAWITETSGYSSREILISEGAIFSLWNHPLYFSFRRTVFKTFFSSRLDLF